MSDQTHPVVMCDGENGMCGAVALDLTLGGLGRIIGSESQLPDGWTGTKPGDRDGGEHYCPDCTRDRIEQGGQR